MGQHPKQLDQVRLYLIIKFSSVCLSVCLFVIKNPEFPEAPRLIKQSKKSNFDFFRLFDYLKRLRPIAARVVDFLIN